MKRIIISTVFLFALLFMAGYSNESEIRQDLKKNPLVSHQNGEQNDLQSIKGKKVKIFTGSNAGN